MLKTSPAPASLGQELGSWGLPRPWAGQGEPSGKGAAEPAVPSGHGQSGPYGAAEISESSLIRSSAARLGNFRFRLKIKRKLKKKKSEAKVPFRHDSLSCQTGYSNDVLLLNNMRHQTSRFTITWVDLTVSTCTFLQHHCSINTLDG